MFFKKKKLYCITTKAHVIVIDKKSNTYVKIEKNYFFLNYNIKNNYVFIDRVFDDTLWR